MRIEIETEMTEEILEEGAEEVPTEAEAEEEGVNPFSRRRCADFAPVI